MMNLVPFLNRHPCVNVVRLSGVIAEAGRFGGGALNDAAVGPLIEKAFSRGRPAAVALALNSPGGSPAQSSLIAARIRRLAEEKGIKVYAFCEDVAASGGYWLACAADEIYVDPNSILGSIGVISASFGFHEAMQRHGIERRVYTAGEDKSLLDPFRPVREQDVKRLKRIQGRIHQGFIDHVKDRRGARLKGDDLFTGEIWVGQEAVDLGLADAIGHLVPTLKRHFGEKVRINTIGQRRPLLSRLGLGAAVAEALERVEDKAHWARFGV